MKYEKQQLRIYRESNALLILLYTVSRTPRASAMFLKVECSRDSEAPKAPTMPQPLTTSLHSGHKMPAEPPTSTNRHFNVSLPKSK